MPDRIVDQHLQAVGDGVQAELRDFGYPKVANAAALPTLTAAHVGTIYTTIDNNISHELVESDGVTAKWRPTADFPDANGDVWEYRVDTNGNLHRWFAKQPPVVLATGGGQDIISGAAIQVPQVDFRAEGLVLSDDYSNGNQGILGQYITAGDLRAWAARLSATGQVQLYGSDDGIAGAQRTTVSTVYDVGITDARKLLIRLDFRHLGATIEVDVSVASQKHEVISHSQEQDFTILETVSFPFVTLFNGLVPVHVGSRFRLGTGVADGRECIRGTVERATITVGGLAIVNFPNPVAAEAWTHSGTNLTVPPPFEDPLIPSDLVTVTREDATGGYVLNVTGHDAAELTLVGDVSPLSFTGWDPAADNKAQRIRVKVLQDATGGRVFDWRQTEGVWAETLGDLSTVGGDTSVQFDVVTLDGGTTISLEPVGVQYGALNCPVVTAAPEADIPAGNNVDIAHNFDMVTSVILIEQATGDYVLPKWSQLGAAPDAPVSIMFAPDALAGEYKARITGSAPFNCTPSTVVSQWQTLNFAAVAASTLNVIVEYVGTPTDVQFVWGDGTVTNPASGGTDSHTYGAAYTGAVQLRWRTSVDITRINMLGQPEWGLNVGVSDLPSTLTRLQIDGTASTLSGGTADLPRTLTILDAFNTPASIIGNAADLPTGMTTLRANNSNSNIQDPTGGNLPAGLTSLLLSNTGSNIGGTTLPAGLTNVQIDETNSTLTIAAAALPAGLTVFAAFLTQVAVTGTGLELPVGLTSFQTHQSNTVITSATTDLPAGLTRLRLDVGDSIISGPADQAPAGLLTFTLAMTPSTVTWPTSFAPAINTALDLSYSAASAGGLTQTEIDQLLADMVAAAVTPVGSQELTLDGPVNAAPSAAGLLDAATLTTNGWNVVTN